MKALLLAVLLGVSLAASAAGATKAKGANVRTIAPGAPVAMGPCACGGAFLCTGPKGGKYCVSPGGSKRYK